MRVVLLGAATLLLSACTSSHICPMYRTNGGIVFDTTAYTAAHPTAAELCLSPGACQPIDRVFVPTTEPGTERLDLTVTTASGEVLLHATTDVRIRYRGGTAGCDNGSVGGDVTIAADGTVTSS